MKKQIYIYFEKYLPEKKIEALSFIEHADNEWFIHLNDYDGRGFNLKEENNEAGIVLDNHGVQTFLNEIRCILNEKPTERTRLALTFLKNKASLQMNMYYMLPGAPIYTADVHGKYALEVWVNQLATKDDTPLRPEDKWKYEDGGSMTGGPTYFSRATLEKFLQEIEEALNEKE